MPVSGRPTLSASRGIALVIVLWMLALLATIAASLVFSTRTELAIAGNLVSSARAEAIADAGVYKAVHELIAVPPADPGRWQGDGRTHDWEFDGARLAIVITDESARIDINAAPEALLRGLFVAQGLAAADAEALADAIADWRDADDLRRLHGAEKDDYAAAGKPHGPANANFDAVEELRQVLGMNEDLYRRVEPLVTVHSGQAGINSAVAPRQVLLAIPGVTPAAVDAFLDQRRAALAQGLMPPLFPAAQAFHAGNINLVVGIQVEAVLGDNTRFFREAVARLTGDGKEAMTVLAWRAPMVPPAAPETAPQSKATQ